MAMQTKKAKSFLTLPPLFKNRIYAYLLDLRLAYGVGLEKILQLGYLVGRQIPKLQTTLFHIYTTARLFVS